MKLKVSKLPLLTSYKLPFFILLFLCFASAILGDSVAEALILSHFDATVILRMYMVNAFFLFLSSLFLMSLIDRVDRGLIFLIFIFLHCIILFIIWVVVLFGVTFLFIPLFSYAYITKIFLFLMFWTLANDIIDSRKAGREFPFIAAGGTLGAICISFTIPWLIKIISAKNLLLVWAVLSVLLAFCFIPIRRSFGRSFKQVSDSEKRVSRGIKSLKKDIALISREPLLANISLLYFLLFFILLNQHYVFYGVIKARFVGAEKLAGFLGYFNGSSMAVTFLLQITIAGIIIRKIGSTRSMFMLPTVLCLVFGTLSIMGMTFSTQQGSVVAFTVLFWGIVGGVGLRIAFFDSFFSPNFQIFFSSLPQDIRGRGKLVIEGVVKPSAMVFASLWLILVTSKISFSINMLILFCISLVMILQTFRIKSKYTESLTQYLRTFKSRLSFFDQSEILSSGDILSFLLQKLRNESYEIKCYIVEVLTKIKTVESIKILTDYMSETDGKTRATIISSLTKLKLDNLSPLFISMLQDSDTGVVASSIFALAAYKDPETNEGLMVFLHHKNERIKANAVIALWAVSNPLKKKKLLKVLEGMLDSNNTETCSSALVAIREINSVQDTAYLLKHFYDSRKENIISDRMLWDYFLHAVGKNPSPALIKALLEMSSSVSKKKRNDIVSSIAEACNNGYFIKRLITDLKSKDVINRGIILKILCVQNPDVTEEMEQILMEIVEEESNSAYKHLFSSNTLTSDNMNTAAEMLSHAIREEYINNHLSNLVHIAAILDQSGKVKKVMHRLNHEDKHVRARALEVLDNVGNMKVNRLVIKLMDTGDKVGDIKGVYEHYLHEENNVSSIITAYSEDSNRWVRECAEYALATHNV